MTLPGNFLFVTLGVVFEGAGGRDNVDSTPFLGPRERGGQFGGPDGWFEQRGKVDVVRGATFVGDLPCRFQDGQLGRLP